MARAPIGLGLAGMGIQREQEAMQTLGTAADMEERRKQENDARRAAAEAGNVGLGTTLGGAAGYAIGTEVGSVGGPWGAVAGAVIGGLAGKYLFGVCLAVSLVALLLPHDSEASMPATWPAPISQMALHQILEYDPMTGIFRWLDPGRNPMVRPGDRAGTNRHGGRYRSIKLGTRSVMEHRLAWLYMTGEWPPAEIDHINRNKIDNRFENLRLATRKQNCENRKARIDSTSAFRGVSWSGGKWTASIMHFGKQVMLGSFEDIELAKIARLEAEGKLFSHSTRP